MTHKKKNSCHIFNIDIFQNSFWDFMNHIIKNILNIELRTFCPPSLYMKAFYTENLLLFRCVSVREDRCFSMAAAVTWAAFGRLAFAMGVSWVMFACITGYGGIINSFLSWPLFSPLSKLTYCTYLIHIDVIFLFFYSTKRPMYFSEYTIVSCFFFLIFTYYILTL